EHGHGDHRAVEGELSAVVADQEAPPRRDLLDPPHLHPEILLVEPEEGTERRGDVVQVHPEGILAELVGVEAEGAESFTQPFAAQAEGEFLELAAKSASD